MTLATLILAATVAAGCQIKSPPHTVALIELYTSQGCSSCPPADRWLSALPRSVPSERAIPLSLHVGYWDYIGWKDPFAQREFNARQRELADLNRNRTVYTPGVFVSAKEWPNWRDAGAFTREVSAINLKPAPLTLELSARAAGDALRITVTATPVQGGALAGEVFIALKQHGHSTAVARGENGGETLRNDHVVRRWIGPLPLGDATRDIRLPADGPREFDLVAFAQDKRSGAVMQAVSLPLATCTRS